MMNSFDMEYDFLDEDGIQCSYIKTLLHKEQNAIGVLCDACNEARQSISSCDEQLIAIKMDKVKKAQDEFQAAYDKRISVEKNYFEKRPNFANNVKENKTRLDSQLEDLKGIVEQVLSIGDQAISLLALERAHLEMAGFTNREVQTEYLRRTLGQNFLT